MGRRLLNIPTTSSSVAVPDLHSNVCAENIQNAQLSVDRRIDEIATNSNDNNNRDTDNSDDEWCEVEERPSCDGHRSFTATSRYH